ncbi:uncharacterized protein [Mobula birostris]|uniref:uncharacterized protein isoform X2 n=1 Tax=Mobula birostris TaxID=1983395 RepID=UPI003B28BDD2
MVGSAIHLVFARVGLTPCQHGLPLTAVASPSERRMQRIRDRMDDSETHSNINFTNRDSRCPSRAEPDVSYAEINFKTVSKPRIRTDRDGLNCTYSELYFRKEEPRIDEDEDPPIALRPGGLPTTAQTDAHEQESKLKIANRSKRQICILRLVTSALIVTVIGLSIHVSQIAKSKFTLDRNYRALNSTLQSKINEIETKFRSVNKTKSQICELLSSRRDQTCLQDWSKSEDRCYFISTFIKSYDGAKKHCSEFDASLLEINSNEEKNAVSKALVLEYETYWTGNCEAGEVTSRFMYKDYNGTLFCRSCDSEEWRVYCNRQHRFICEKSAHSCTDISEKIQNLCEQSIGPT